MDDDDVWTMDQKGGGTRVQTGGFDVVMEVLIPTTSHVPAREGEGACVQNRTHQKESDCEQRRGFTRSRPHTSIMHITPTDFPPKSFVTTL